MRHEPNHRIAEWSDYLASLKKQHPILIKALLRQSSGSLAFVKYQSAIRTNEYKQRKAEGMLNSLGRHDDMRRSLDVQPMPQRAALVPREPFLNSFLSWLS